MGLRSYNPVYVPLRANEIVLPVNSTIRFESARGGIVVNRYNELGFRGPGKPTDFDDATTIVTVGGSTTACVGLSDEDTWPDRLAALLSQDVADLWLNNAGMDGHSTFGHSILLEQMLASLRPDIVLYLVGVNEIDRDDLNRFDSQLDPGNESLRNRIVAKSELLSTLQVLAPHAARRRGGARSPRAAGRAEHRASDGSSRGGGTRARRAATASWSAIASGSRDYWTGRVRPPSNPFSSRSRRFSATRSTPPRESIWGGWTSTAEWPRRRDGGSSNSTTM